MPEFLLVIKLSEARFDSPKEFAIVFLPLASVQINQEMRTLFILTIGILRPGCQI